MNQAVERRRSAFSCQFSCIQNTNKPEASSNPTKQTKNSTGGAVTSPEQEQKNISITFDFEFGLESVYVRTTEVLQL